MKNSKPHMRCAQCGRTYSDARWNQNEHWCPTCEKFVCSKCITKLWMCTSCGNTVNKYAYISSIMGFFLGVGCAFSMIIFITLGSVDNYYFFGTVVATTLCFLFTVILYLQFIDHRDKHIEYLSNMPAGVIPFKDRVGYDDVTVQEKLLASRISNRIFPAHLYIGLIGNWSIPVISNDETVEVFSKFQKRAKIIIYITASLGIAIWIIGVLMGNVIMVFAVIGTIFFVITSLVLGMSQAIKERTNKDAELETQASWKKIGRMKTIKVVKKFLKQNGEKYTKKKLRWGGPQASQKPTYKYVFENGNYISNQYQLYETGYFIGKVGIGFTYPHYLHAKNLQRDLDGYLGERDLIERF